MTLVERLTPRLLETVEWVALPGAGRILVHPDTGACVEVPAADAGFVAGFDGRHALAEIARSHAESHGEPGFRRLVPLCRELAAAGFLSLPEGQSWPEDWGVEAPGGPRQRPWRFVLGAKRPLRLPWPRLPVGLIPGLALLATLVVAVLAPGRLPALDPASPPEGPVTAGLAWLMAGLTLSARSLVRALVALSAGGRLHRVGLAAHLGLPVLSAEAGEAARAGRAGRLSLALAGLAGGALGTAGCLAVSTLASPSASLAGSLAALVSGAVLLGHLCPLLPGDAGALLAELAPDDRFAPRLRAWLARGILRGMWRSSLERRGIALRPQEERFYLAATLLCGLWTWLAMEVQQVGGEHFVDPVLLPLARAGEAFPLDVVAGVAAALVSVASVGVIALAALPVVLWLVAALLPGRPHRPRPPADDAAPSAEELARQPLFARVAPDALAGIVAATRVLRFAAHDVVVRQGDPGETCYTIRSGRAEVLVEDHTGLRTRVATLGPGDAFGELALVGEGRRKATVRAVGPLVLLSLDRQSFERALAAQSLAASEVTELLRETQLLRELPFFADFTADALARLSLALQPHPVAPGEAVVTQGEPGEHFFLVQSGTLDVFRDGELVGRLKRGDCFGEVALLQKVPRVATVVCVEAAHLLRLGEADFLRAVDASFRFGEHVDALGARRGNTRP